MSLIRSFSSPSVSMMCKLVSPVCPLLNTICKHESVSAQHLQTTGKAPNGVAAKAGKLACPIEEHCWMMQLQLRMG